MHTSLLYLFLIFLASLVAGVMNAVAGGGTLVAFPALLFAGVPPIVANATTSLGLWPSAATGGWVYRKEITTSRRTLLLLVLMSLAGGFAGSWLLLHTPEHAFNRLIPVLLLFALALFTVSGKVRRMAERMSISPRHLEVVAILGQFAVAVYGGYFGAAMGVLMLTLYSLTLSSSIHSMNGVRTFCGSATNAIAVVVFIFGHRIDWMVAAVMASGAVIGATGGALAMRRLDPKLARRVVLILAWTMTLTYVARMGL